MNQSCRDCANLCVKDLHYGYCMAMSSSGVPRTPKQHEWQEPNARKNMPLRDLDASPPYCPGKVVGTPGFARMLTYRPGAGT